MDGEEASGIWGLLANATYPADAGAVVARASVPMSRAAEVMELVSSWDGWWSVARAGDGMVYAGPHDVDDLAEIKQKLGVLRGRAEEAGGFAVLEAGPVELKREFAGWGEELGNLDLMRRLKESFDPAGILGCGRFLPGL